MVRGQLLRWLSVSLILALVASGVSTAGVLGTGLAQPGERDLLVMRLPYPGPAVTTRWLELGWDVWSVHPQEGVDLALSSFQADAVARALGVQPLDVEQAPSPRWLSCYLGNASIEASLRQLTSSHPDIAELVEVGPTWESLHARGVKRRIWALRLTRRDGAGPKPVFVVMGLHHAREVVTPALALALAERLAAAYGIEPTLTWLLDTSEIWVLPAVNPDGLIKVEARQNWRKNVNRDVCGDQPPRDGRGPGVDLNRNYGYFWGGRGASTDECAETYRGSGPFSEPETTALRNFLTELQPNLVVSLHSYSELVLYPFGYTSQPAPDASELAALAQVWAAHTGYRPIPTHELYFASGDACDWVYGQLGAPCLTIEIGSARENYFWPTCAQLGAQVSLNLPALIHATRLVPAPYGLALGPLTDEVTVQESTQGLRVEAKIDDTKSGGQEIRAARVWFNAATDVAAGWEMQLQPSGPATAHAWVNIDLAERLAVGTWILVRGQDQDGNWGPVGAAWFQASEASSTPSGAPSPTATATQTALPPTALPPVAPSPEPTATPTVTTTALPSPSATPVPSSTAATASATPRAVEYETPTATPHESRSWRIYAPFALQFRIRQDARRSALAAKDGSPEPRIQRRLLLPIVCFVPKLNSC